MDIITRKLSARYNITHDSLKRKKILNILFRWEQFLNLFRKNKHKRIALQKSYEDATDRMAKQIMAKEDANMLEELKQLSGE